MRVSATISAAPLSVPASTYIAASSTSTPEIKAQLEGKNKKQAAELVGETVAKRAKDKGVEKVVFDRGGYLYTGRVQALADGARKGGLDF